ncbi:ATP-binding cassette domain-containing protein [Roseovarius rhodophyticola]|uniref:ATP-binding cassette domain-containing protein n=1 Tax=Roseovarius rhodophyticola TaxID=3080827 RepID=A0ABZ2THV7_9RHOB|nr:ATP-binding cassette domain-containing protein [Roseovarius sp. W115]MDV2929612.1 ATP-binding cassette domain-containing protein [Roseovarius sp. W115]
MLKLEDCIIRNGAFELHANLSVAERARVAVIGPSGAGKSTLIEAIAGFLPVATGRITWKGQDITDMPPGARPLTMLFQEDNLFPHLSVAQNVGLGIQPNLRLSPTDHAAVRQALNRVGLSGMHTRKPLELSGGQRSRAALARVLVQRRDLLLLDEPFAALGPALRAEMLDLVQELCEETGATLLMISHAPEDARRIAGECILVADGAAHPPQETTALLDNPPKVLRDYLG